MAKMTIEDKENVNPCHKNEGYGPIYPRCAYSSKTEYQ
jgi:hypothetical protein